MLDITHQLHYNIKLHTSLYTLYYNLVFKKLGQRGMTCQLFASHYGKENFKQKQSDLSFFLKSFLYTILQTFTMVIKSLEDRKGLSNILSKKSEITIFK